jgi:predicted DNA-binding protein
VTRGRRRLALRRRVARADTGAPKSARDKQLAVTTGKSCVRVSAMDLSLQSRPACYFRWRLSPKPARSDAQRSARISAVRTPELPTMAEQRTRDRRRAGRPPAGAKEGEKVKDYPQLSIRVPLEFKARLNALSAVTGLAQWRVIVEAINCFFSDLPQTDRELVDGLSERLMRAGQA